MSAKYTELNINDLELLVHLGWPEEERQQTQTVLVDIGIRFRLNNAATHSDDLANTLCYDRLSQTITRAVQSKIYKLIEYLCHDIYELVKAAGKVDCAVTVKKTPPVDNIKGFATFTCSDWEA